MKSPVALGLALLFVLFAIVQYNDPDPQIWIPVYGFAAVACLLGYTGLRRPFFFGLLTVLYAIAAIWQWPPAFEGFWLNEVGMKSTNVELARESGGLAICALAMGWLVWKATK